MSNQVNVLASNDSEVVVSRVFDASRADVFSALTSPELLKRWFSGPDGWKLDECSVDLRVDGAFRYKWTGVDGEKLVLLGEFNEIRSDEIIGYSERFEDEPVDARRTVIELEAIGPSTRFTSRTRYASSEARDRAIQSNMAAGFAAAFARLDALISED